MDSKYELADSSQLPKEGQLIPKIEPIDVDFIEKEEVEGEYSVAPGKFESLKVIEESIKKELLEVEGSENCSSSIV